MIRNLSRIIFLFFLATLLLLVAASGFLFVGKAEPAERISWGITFSHLQAQDLGLDWQETYLALLDDISVREMRLPVYWNELEKEEGVYDFSVWDWQLEELEKRGGKAVLVVGYKLPRWPECHIPSRLEGTPPSAWEKELFQMMREVVTRYKDNSTVWAWQVENEPLWRFGICPDPDANLLDAELSLVRQLDPSRPIIVTDTGEYSLWIEVAKRADIFGSTLYRVSHDPRIGFFEYPYPPVMYHRKSTLVKWFFPDVRTIFAEVQAEPWVENLPVTQYSLETQYETMSPDQFRANIEYVRQTGFDMAYLWGAEWWFWLTEEAQDDQIWQIAKELFTKNQ